MAVIKSVYLLGVFALLGAINADSGSNEDFGSNEERGRCYCKWNSCLGVAANQVVGCPNTNAFRVCTSGVCSVQPCQAGQVWNIVKNACSTCDVGKHISLDQQVCTCDQGTTLNSRTGACGPCPTGSQQIGERCSCVYPLALHETSNTCRACPADAPNRGNECVCTSTTLFFNEETWTCAACPGTLIPPRRGYGKSSCRCTGLNQIFRDDNASCYTCPTGTFASSEDCQCARYSGLKFDYTTGTCYCRLGYTLNASGVCVLGTNTITP